MKTVANTVHRISQKGQWPAMGAKDPDKGFGRYDEYRIKRRGAQVRQRNAKF